GWVSDALRGTAVCLAFFEDSTRTRVSFELAAHRLGAMPVTLLPHGSSMSKGETLLDTLQTVVSMRVDLVVVRHGSAGAAAYLARHLDAGVIKAGDGAPHQAGAHGAEPDRFDSRIRAGMGRERGARCTDEAGSRGAASRAVQSRRRDRLRRGGRPALGDRAPGRERRRGALRGAGAL